VLNNNPIVTQDIRVRVQEAIRTLGYKPYRAAQRLRSNTSDVIGLIISDIQNSFFTAVARGVEDEAYAHQMNVVLCNSDEDVFKQEKYLQVMQAERVAGLIITPAEGTHASSLDQHSALGLPVVLVDRTVDSLEADTVIVDNHRGAYEATWHLLSLGYERIGVVTGHMNLTTAHERYQGYRDALNAAGVPVDERLIKVGDYRYESGYRSTRELMELPHPPRAIFAANNIMTLGALHAIRELGLQVPRDVALIGFDDMPWSGEVSPPLTTVSQPTYQLGQEAVRLLLRRLEDSQASYQTVVLLTQLIVRQSCGGAPISEPG
jgi:DNA-binding LacI/PurR family transcriptional regulator